MFTCAVILGYIVEIAMLSHLRSGFRALVDYAIDIMLAG